MSYRHQEILFGLFLFAIGCGLMSHAFSPQYAMMAQDIQTDPMFFPKIILSGWIFCSAAMVIRAFRRTSKEKMPFEWLRCAAAVLVMSAFVFFFDMVGNFPCAIFCFFFLGLILGNPHPRRLLLISILYAGFIDVLFRYGLSLYLPNIPGL